MENVNVKGTKAKTKRKKTEEELLEGRTPVRTPKPKDTKKLSVAEAERSAPSAYAKAQIKKMSEEQKEVAVKFMVQRNKARVEAHLEPAYSQEDLDLYK